MARSSGDTLGLGELGYATGHNANVSTTTSLNQANGSAGTTVSLDDFAIDEIDNDEVGITVEDATPTEGETIWVNMNFVIVGSKFLSKIGNQTRNFTWDHADASGNGTFASADYSAAWTAPAVGSNTTATLRGEFNDFFNAHATNYGTAITKQVVIQDDGSGTGGGGGCFAVGTEILMNDNTWKRVETIQINDVVKNVSIPSLPDADEYSEFATWQGKNLNNMSTGSSVVVATSIDYYYDHYKITDSNNDTILVTSEHPFLIKRDDGVVDVDGTDRSYYRFVRVKELVATDKLVKSDGTLLTIHSLEVINSEDQFCNINIEEMDCYIVRWGTNAFVAHNKGA